MTVKIFYSAPGSDLIMNVAEKLAKQHDIVPVYWSTSGAEEDVVKKHFPGVYFHDVFDAVYGIAPDGFEQSHKCHQLGGNILLEYAELEAVLWEMMLTRADPEGGFGYYEFSQYYHRYLANALTLTDALEPDLWVSDSSPHMMHDLVLLEVFKKKNIPCCILQDTVVPGRLLAVDKLADTTDMVRAKMENKGAGITPISKTTNEYILRVQGNSGHGQPYTSDLYFNGEGQSYHYEAKIAKRLKQKYRRQKKLVFREQWRSWFGRPSRPAIHYYKEPGKRWENSYSTRLSWLKVYKRLIKRQQGLLDQYMSLSVYPQRGDSYVYVPLQWQPECTSVPNGGRLSDQLFFVKLLSSILPDGICIYVKENMAQFEWHRGSFARHAWYYDEMNSIHGVRLIKTDVDSFSLIDNCFCVSTLTGTAGFEAIVRGKPAIVGGDMVWYKDAPGVFPVKNAEQMAKALGRIEVGVHIDNQKLERFLSVYEGATYHCVTNEEKLKHLGLDREENIRELSRAIFERYQFSVKKSSAGADTNA